MIDSIVAPTPETNLDDSYLAARYTVFASPPAVLRFVREPGVRPVEPPLLAQPWCIITAFNPGSEQRGDAENAACSEALRARILEMRGHEPRRTVASDDLGRFSEPGFLVERCPRAAALQLAAEFGQRAVVFCEGSPTEIGLLFPASHEWLTRPTYWYPVTI